MSANRQSPEPPHFYGWRSHSQTSSSIQWAFIHLPLSGQYLFTLQAQQEYPPDMQCKDKFLLQSTIVPPHTDVDELPQDTFNKDSGRAIEECKLRVLYISPASAHANSENQALAGSTQSPDANSNQAVQRLKDERDAAVQQTQQLKQELDMLKRRRPQKTDHGFSLTFAIIVALIGIVAGFLLNFSLSSPSAE